VKAVLARLKATYAYRCGSTTTTPAAGCSPEGSPTLPSSRFPALTLGFAIFGFILRGNPGLFHDVVHSVSTTLPGIVKDSAHPTVSSTRRSHRRQTR